MLETQKSNITKRRSNFQVYCKLKPQDENNQKSSTKRIKRECSLSPNKLALQPTSSSNKNTSYLQDNNYCVFSSLDDNCRSVVYLKNPIKGHLIERYFKTEKDLKTYKDSLFNHSKYYNLDKVFKPSDNNYTIFKKTAKNLVNECVKGRDCTYIVYGPKYSGKNDILLGNGNGMINQAYEEMANLVHITKQAGNYNECVSMIMVTASCVYSGKLYDLFTNKPVEKSTDLKSIEVIDLNDLFTYLKYFKNYGKILGNQLNDPNFKKKSISIFSLSYVFMNQAKNAVVKKHSVNFLKSTIDSQNIEDEMVKKFRDMLINIGVCSNEHISSNSTKNKLCNLLSSFLTSDNLTGVMLTIKGEHQNRKVNKKLLDFSQTIRDCVQHSLGNTSAFLRSNSNRSINNKQSKIRRSKSRKSKNSVPRSKNPERTSTEKRSKRSASNQRETNSEKFKNTIIDTQNYKDFLKDKNQNISTAIDDIVSSIHQEIDRLYEQAILSKKFEESNYETFCDKINKIDQIMKKINYKKIMGETQITSFYRDKFSELLNLTLNNALATNYEDTSNYELGLGKTTKFDDLSEKCVGKDKIYIKNEIMLPNSGEKGESALKSKTGFNEDAVTMTKQTGLYGDTSYNDKISLYKNIEMEIMSLKNDIIANIEEESIKKVEKAYASNHKKSSNTNIDNRSSQEFKDTQITEKNIENIMRELRVDSLNSNAKSNNMANNRQNSASYRKEESNSYEKTGSYTVKHEDESMQRTTNAGNKKEDFLQANKEQLEKLGNKNLVEDAQVIEVGREGNETENSKITNQIANRTENEIQKPMEDNVGFENYKNIATGNFAAKGFSNYDSGFSFNSPMATNNLPTVFPSPLMQNNSELESYRLKMAELESQVKTLETVTKDLENMKFQNIILHEENTTVNRELEYVKHSCAKKESDMSTRADEYYQLLQETIELKGLEEAELKGKFMEKDVHIESLIDQVNEIKIENEDLKAEMKQMREIQFDLENTNMILQTKNDKAAERYKDELNDYQTEKDRVISSKIEKVTSLKIELDKLEIGSKELKLENTDLKLSFERSSNARQYKIDTDSLKRTISELRQELIMKDKENDYCKTQINDLKDEKSKLEIKRHELLEDLREKNKQDKFHLELRQDEMKKEQGSKDNYCNKIREDLKKKKSDLLDTEEALNNIKFELGQKEDSYLNQINILEQENDAQSKGTMHLQTNLMKANIGLTEKKDELELRDIKENRQIAESRNLKIHLDQKSNFIKQTESQLTKYVDYKNDELVSLSNNDNKEREKSDKLQALNQIKILIAKNREKSKCNPQSQNERHVDTMKRTARLIDNAIKKKN